MYYIVVLGLGLRLLYLLREVGLQLQQKYDE